MNKTNWKIIISLCSLILKNMGVRLIVFVLTFLIVVAYLAHADLKCRKYGYDSIVYKYPSLYCIEEENE